jgi:hypothetical protein
VDKDESITKSADSSGSITKKSYTFELNHIFSFLLLLLGCQQADCCRDRRRVKHKSRKLLAFNPYVVYRVVILCLTTNSISHGIFKSPKCCLPSDLQAPASRQQSGRRHPRSQRDSHKGAEMPDPNPRVVSNQEQSV